MELLTIFPLSGCRIDESIEFICGDSLWVDVHPDWLQFHVSIRLIQGPQDLAFPSASIANDKDGVSYVSQLFKLDYLQNKVVFSL